MEKKIKIYGLPSCGKCHSVVKTLREDFGFEVDYELNFDVVVAKGRQHGVLAVPFAEHEGVFVKNDDLNAFIKELATHES